MSSKDTFFIKRDKSKAVPIATEMPCGHIHWGKAPDSCPTCAEIKAARGEVLELAKDAIYGFRQYAANQRKMVDNLRQAYQERFGE